MTHLLALSPDAMLRALSDISSVASGALVAAVWEGAVLVAGVALALRVFRGIPAAGRSAVWSAVLMLLVMLPLAHMLGAARGDKGVAAVGHRVWHVDERVSVGLVALWAAFATWRLLQLARSAAFLRTLARTAVPVVTGDEPAAILRAAGRRVELCISDGVDRPSVVGFFAPRILIPSAVFAELRDEELQQILLHETEHIRRGDDWVNVLQKLSLALFPLNPALHWVERRMCLERELACDDRVLESTGARKAYAACLASLAGHRMVRRGVSLALGAWERRPELVRRVERILSGDGTQGSMSPRMSFAAVMVLLAGAVAGGDLLSHSPDLVSFAPTVREAGSMAAVKEPALPVAADRLASASMPAAMLNVKTTMRVAVGDAPARLRIRVPQHGPRTMPDATRPDPATAQAVAYRGDSRIAYVTERTESVAQRADEQGMVVMVSWQTRAVRVPVGNDQVTAASERDDYRPQPATASRPAAQPAQSSEVRYAAVPTRNGWLFFQL